MASSLDYATTLASVARLSVPYIADWCAVEVVGGGGAVQQLALVHRDPLKVEWARELNRRYPPDPESPTGVHRVIRTGAAEIMPVISDEALVAAARDEQHLKTLREVGFTSYMCVPLVAREKILGAITFVSAESGHHFDESDLTLAQDLARRAAIAVDNAQLYQDAQREQAALKTALEALHLNKEELRQKEERLRLALDAGQMGIWDWDVKSGALSWTEHLEPIHGFAPGTFDGRYETFLAAIHPEDRPAVGARIANALQTCTHYETEFRVVFPDGSVHWLMGTGQAFRDSSGEPSRMIGVGMDISARKQLEEKLRQSQKLESVGLLAGGVAHDFNNLLTGVLGNASLAMDLLPQEHSALPLLDEVVLASERAADLTRQLLAYSGKGQYVIQPLDLSQLIREISSLIQVSLPKMVQLRLDLAAGLPLIEGDTSQIQQIIMNLVLNGAEAIGDKSGTVLVRTEYCGTDPALPSYRPDEEFPAQNCVLLEVHDTGCGMDNETVDRIFDPFFTTKFTGRGLGLAAVSGIVRSHRGTIRVFSEPGQGSTFRVLFPAVGQPSVSSAREHSTPDLKGNGVVLVIDDEDVVRRAAEAALSRFGYSVLVAENGREGVEVFDRNAEQISLVLLDMTMPLMNGAEAIRHLRRIRPDIPVIASSGYSEMEASQRFHPYELSGFIQKPYTALSLAAKVKSALMASRQAARS